MEMQGINLCFKLEEPGCRHLLHMWGKWKRRELWIIERKGKAKIIQKSTCDQMFTD